MGKDQNANGGLVCAHPAFGIIHIHRPVLSFFIRGRDSIDPAPVIFPSFSSLVLLVFSAFFLNSCSSRALPT
jgi:hypothetical protein